METTKRIQILKTEYVDINRFVNFWKKFYDGTTYSEEKYRNAINRMNVIELFEWKNGMPLSAQKKKTVKFLKNKINEFNNNEISYEEFWKVLKGGIVWNIFALHIANHKKYPIFDKYTCMTFIFIKDKKIEPKPEVSKEVYEEYRNFVLRLGINLRDIDKAFWAFGKFINKYNITKIDV